jgi:4'-phosphopantetheinyl transferase
MHMTADAWPFVDRAPPLGPEDVHVWQAPLDDDESAFMRLLAPAERERAAKFHFARDRRRFTIGRGRLRLLLAEYLMVDPLFVPIETTPLGKPFVAGDLQFNVTHSDELALYAISRGRDIGVDVELERADVEWRELAERFFAPEEVTALIALPANEQRSAFYRCWTRKEAYIKGLGLGMHVPLDGFAVTIADPAKLIHTSHDPSQSKRWTIKDLRPASGYAGALAVEAPSWRLVCGRWGGIP